MMEYVVRILTWILVAIVLHFIDKKLLKGSFKIVWLVFLMIAFLVFTFVPVNNQLLVY